MKKNLKKSKKTAFAMGDLKNAECKSVDVVPLVVGVLGSVIRKLGQSIEKLGINILSI